jgi:hypothetical protein
MWTARMTVVVLVASTPLSIARGQAASPTSGGAPPAQYAAASPGPLIIPVEARGYHLTDSVKLGKASDGMQYVYKQRSDVAKVSVVPYGGNRPVTQADTLSLVQQEVELVRRPIQDAARIGELQNLAQFGDRASVIRVGGRAVNYYWYFAGVRRRGQPAVFLYYAVYATPFGLVKVRAELPWNSAGSSGMLGVQTALDPLSSFGHTVVGAMMAQPFPISASTGGAVRSAALPAVVIPPACAAMPPATDTVKYRVYATIETPGRSDSLPSAYLGFVLDALRQGVVVPNPLGVTVYAPMASPGGDVMAPAVYGEIEFTLDEGGKVSDVHLTQSSLSPALDQSLYDAPRRADSMQAFPAEIGVTDPGPVRFFVSFSAFQSRLGQSLPMFAVRMPAWKPGTRPGIDPEHDERPVFRVAVGGEIGAVGDSVAIQFVVDERGMPVKNTVRLLSAKHVQYAQAVIDATLRSQFTPAMAAGCPVKGLTERSSRLTAGQQ